MISYKEFVLDTAVKIYAAEKNMLKYTASDAIFWAEKLAEELVHNGYLEPKEIKRKDE